MFAWTRPWPIACSTSAMIPTALARTVNVTVEVVDVPGVVDAP